MSRALLLLALAACSQSDVPAASTTRTSTPVAGGLEVRDAWARPADSGATGGAYVSLANLDSAAITITGWRSDAAESTAMHETAVHDGMARMVPRDRMDIVRGCVLTMAPGGLHLMLTRLTRALHEGDTIRVTVSLADGREVVAPVVVRAP